MRLTARCRDLLRLLRAARWLTTGQVRRRFFPRATVNAARRRLRRLAAAGYLRKHQEDRMREALFTLGREGARVLEKSGSKTIRLERTPPAQLDHFLAVNTIRIAAELCGSLSYFFSYWELPASGWRHSLIPDAVFALEGRAFAAEFDRGVEGIRFFMRTKIAAYRRGLPGFPLAAVLVVVDRDARMDALARAIADERGQFLFTTIDAIRQRGLLAPIYHRYASGASAAVVGTCSLEVSRRKDNFRAANDAEATSYKKSGGPS